ncbi:MAG: DEAD/DEAH box helicase family protein, partial [Candidatus Lokiarchaeota archaeon]|nr:DEAD/DEAH box helicase family protein [Candidatus Lokiarchaeota archaeon]
MDEEEEGEEETAQDGGEERLRPPTLKGLFKKKAAPTPTPDAPPTRPEEPAVQKEAARPVPEASQGMSKDASDGDDDREEEEESGGEKRARKPARSRKKKADIVALLRGAGVRTVIVDEAHHLRSAWWTSLNAVIAGLDNPTVVALTATPPYDVDPAEWERYTQLCGPIDAEINVPELVKVQNLCPHQDYVLF